MTNYTKDINKTEGLFGVEFTGTVGTGGITKGYPAKISANRTIVLATGATDLIIGIAKDTIAESKEVTVLGNGCLVIVPFTLTAGQKVGFDGTSLEDYTSKTIVGVTFAAGTLASVIRVHTQYAMA